MATLIKETTIKANSISTVRVETFTLKGLSSIQMHILLNAMAAYQRQGYAPDNQAHSDAAESFGNELLDLYTTELLNYTKSK